MSLRYVLDSLEEYQALTSQEGQYIDKLTIALKCAFIQSKWLSRLEREQLKSKALTLLKLEEEFCSKIDNHLAKDIILRMKHLIMVKY